MMQIHGVEVLAKDEPVMARAGKSVFITRMQACGLIRVAVRRAAWQTAQTLAGVLEDMGHADAAETLRGMSSEELADGIDVSVETPTAREAAA